MVTGNTNQNKKPEEGGFAEVRLLKPYLRGKPGEILTVSTGERDKLVKDGTALPLISSQPEGSSAANFNDPTKPMNKRVGRPPGKK